MIGPRAWLGRGKLRGDLESVDWLGLPVRQLDGHVYGTGYQRVDGHGQHLRPHRGVGGSVCARCDRLALWWGSVDQGAGKGHDPDTESRLEGQPASKARRPGTLLVATVRAQGAGGQVSGGGGCARPFVCSPAATAETAGGAATRGGATRRLLTQRRLNQPASMAASTNVTLRSSNVP